MAWPPASPTPMTTAEENPQIAALMRMMNPENPLGAALGNSPAMAQLLAAMSAPRYGRRMPGATPGNVPPGYQYPTAPAPELAPAALGYPSVPADPTTPPAADATAALGYPAVPADPTTPLAPPSEPQIMTNPTPDRQPGGGMGQGGGGVTPGAAGAFENEDLVGDLLSDPSRISTWAFGNSNVPGNFLLNRGIDKYQQAMPLIAAIQNLLGGGDGTVEDPASLPALMRQMVLGGRGASTVRNMVQDLLGRAMGGDENALAWLETGDEQRGQQNNILKLIGLADQGRTLPGFQQVRINRAQRELEKRDLARVQRGTVEGANDINDPTMGWANVLARLAQ